MKKDEITNNTILRSQSEPVAKCDRLSNDEIENRIIKSVINSNSLGVVCEKCGSKEITEISYGLPAWIIVDEPIDSRIEKLIEERRIVLGGCTKRDESPRYYCRACGTKFGNYSGTNL